MGGIRPSHILKAQMDTPLQQLDPPHRSMRNHRSTANLMISLQLLDLPKEKVNLIPPPPLPLEFQLDFFKGGQECEEEGKKKGC